MTKNVVLTLLLLVGCGGDDAPSVTTSTNTGTTTECTPSDEICNGVDDDCDGLVDESDALDAFVFYEDADNDGFGNPDAIATSCNDAVEGYLLDENTDCDDTSDTTYPGADEYCDGADNDCDNETDEDDAVDAPTWYVDNDKDGFGDATQTIITCYESTGVVGDNTDCDDNIGTIYPGADEYCDGVDTDCDGVYDNDDAIGAPTWYADSDNDGYGNSESTTVACYESKGWTGDNTDCDDNTNTTYPGAPEYCDGVDTDCNATVDDDYALDATTYFADTDNDSYGDLFNTYNACSLVSGYVSDNTDCDDSTNTTYPGAPEYCDSVDTDCNGTIDDDYASDALTWFVDSDGDTYGDPTETKLACSQPIGFVSDASDCDDTTNTVSPSASEYCNGIDNDCNGTIDDDYASGAGLWFADTDGDGYGDPTNTQRTCYESAGWVANNNDCDDSTDTISPIADEYCDGVDTNCNSILDDSSAVDANTYYADADEDSYGDPDETWRACSPPSGWVEDNNDCNDANYNSYPGATEICDEDDNDCDGSTDEGVQDTFYYDGDYDGYGDPTVQILACTAPVKYTSDNTDCNDANNDSYPGATEICDEDDNDCDGSTDEGVQIVFYGDADNDGYGTYDDMVYACSEPAGYASSGSDCDDTDAYTHPGATEYCNGVDNDCNGSEISSGVGLNFNDGLSWFDATSFFSTTYGYQTTGYSFEGDWFFCGNTTYYVNWDINHDVNVTGVNGTPTLDGGNRDSVIDVNTNAVSFNNIKIENGGNVSNGAGIYQTGGSLALVDVDIKYNDAESQGGGIYLSSGAVMSGENLYFYNNTAGSHGGGIYIIDGELDIHDSYFYFNTADSKGGGIRAYEADSVTLEDTYFYYNYADYDSDDVGGGGAIALDGTSLSASDSGTGTYSCKFKANNDWMLGAVLLDDSTADFSDCDFTSNTDLYDNGPHDIVTNGTGYSYEYDTNTSVSCDSDGCGSSSLAWHGAGGTLTEYSTSTDKEFGNIYLANTTRTLDEMSFWIMTEYDCYPTFSVYESETYNGTLTKVWSETIATPTNGGSEEYYFSPPIGIPVTSGLYYTLTLDVDSGSCGRLDYTYSSSIYSSVAHFGTHVGSYNNGSASYGPMYYTTISSSH